MLNFDIERIRNRLVSYDTFYHVSNHKYIPGQILKIDLTRKNKRAWLKGWKDPSHEFYYLEKYRPRNCVPRNDLIYTCAADENISYLFFDETKEGYHYEVEPCAGNILDWYQHDFQWSLEVQKELEKKNPHQDYIRQLALGYWSGATLDFSLKTSYNSFEFRFPSVKVIKQVRYNLPWDLKQNVYQWDCPECLKI